MSNDYQEKDKCCAQSASIGHSPTFCYDHQSVMLPDRVDVD